MFRSLLTLAADGLKGLSAVFGFTSEEERIVQLLIGQGNPGAKYQSNRHNVGFMVMDEIAREYGFGPWRSKFQAQISEGRVAGQKMLLMKPETFYNETGRSAQAAMKFYKLSPQNISVFHDEIDLAPGRVRVKFGGGHSGNNGIRSMIAHVGADVHRIRIGVGHPGDKSKVMSHVLADFGKADQAWLEPLLRACAKALPMYVTETPDKFQSEVMRLAPAPKHDPKQTNRPAS